MNNETKLLNPFSARLEKQPIETNTGKLIYTDGDFKIYKKYSDHYLHTFKNIIIAERGGANKAIFSNIKGETKPTGEAAIYHEYERPLQAMNDGIEYAKKLNFQIK